MSSSTTRKGIRATKGNTGGLRGSLRPLAQAAVGLAATTALAQDPAAQEPQQPAPEEQITLPTVQVEEEKESYNPPESNLKRLPKPLVDTPQTVTVVPERVMEEQVATTLTEALRNVSGITVAAGEGGRQGDAFVLRGFSAQTDTTRDGVRDLGWFTRDTFNVQNVEVFFGPSAVLFGRGSTGGAINLATKRPVAESFQEVKLIGGTAPSGRVEADVNEALSEDLQLRLNVMGQLAGVAGRDVVQRDRAGIAPSARLKLGDKTTLEADYLYQHEDGVPDYGQPYFNGQPVSSTYGVSRENFYGLDADQTLVNAHVGTALLQHRFTDTLRLSNTLRFGHVDRFSRPTSPRNLRPTDAPTAPTAIGRQRFETATDNTNLINQTDLRAELSTGPLQHTLNVGFELARETRDQFRSDLRVAGAPNNGQASADLFNPDPSEELAGLTRVPGNSSTTLQRSVGAYLSDQVEITKYVEVLGSLRVDRFDTRYAATNLERPLAPRIDTFLNWRAGLVLHPVEATSVYAMYGTSKNPSAELGSLTDDTVNLDPEDNRTFEVGAKADLLDERLSLSGALFRVEKTNARVNITGPDGTLTVLGGNNRVQGVNVGVAGQVVEWLNLLANYTFMDSEILDHPVPDSPLIGQRLPQTPEHSMSLWATLNPIRGLSLGGGAVYQSETEVNNPATAAAVLNSVPGYVRFDAVAIYAWRNTELQLNLNNLTNALYYSEYYAGHAVPADGRSAMLSGRVRF
jgi:catecholate siderophore receptor